MKLKVVVHEAEEDSYWAEVPSIPGCAIQETPSKSLSHAPVHSARLTIGRNSSSAPMAR